SMDRHHIVYLTVLQRYWRLPLQHRMGMQGVNSTATGGGQRCPDHLHDHGEFLIDRPSMRHIPYHALLEEQLWQLRIAPVIACPQAALHPVLFHRLSSRIPYGLARALRKARQDI